MSSSSPPPLFSSTLDPIPPPQLPSPSSSIAKEQSIKTAMSTLMDEYSSYSQSAPTEVPVMQMYQQNINAMGSQLSSFYTQMASNKDMLTTYIAQLNDEISRLSADNKQLKFMTKVDTSRGTVSDDLQADANTDLLVQQYINYSLYFGVLLELVGVVYILRNPNTTTLP